ncbi:MAG: M23 family metallopeptidase [Gammaproteobacteria bacterium]|nr:M23 family metallopeptidase [Gammaproteobacteria bacterium]MBT4449348.1 M23 family metallopeptidase [Gammaproteobacteria bacterium]MBT4862316.1 M23 family metallopeptidase [Gammaproteobacteria bacterium]MBT6552276.1 M23 family metallopeptidase [Gammaproteobacteria bacterium]MBT6702576.1 M23 family metallopeptidase [Gammaproteobacteria bacterium]
MIEQGQEETDSSSKKFRDTDQELPFGFNVAFREYESEDKRRSVFLNPEESLAANLIDLYTGRINTLEIRNSSTDHSVASKALSIALERVKTDVPPVTVIPVTMDSNFELAESLRALAHRIEHNPAESKISISTSSSLDSILPLKSDECSLNRVEAGSRRWRSNGTILEQAYRDVYTCVSADSCCGNDTYTSHGEWRWVELWRDTQDSTNRPPNNPPPFERYPWDNCCPILPAPINAEVSSDWGWRTIDGAPDFHPGMDIAVPVGTSVINAATGDIVHINRTSPGGNTGIIIKTNDEIRQYWHVDVDQALEIGMQIGAGMQLGVTANYPAPHLHFARYRPPEGDWWKKGDSNSLSPCP